MSYQKLEKMVQTASLQAFSTSSGKKYGKKGQGMLVCVSLIAGSTPAKAKAQDRIYLVLESLPVQIDSNTMMHQRLTNVEYRSLWLLCDS